MWRGINQKLVQRALAEARAGKSAVDVYEGSGHGMEILHREALLEKFWSPAFGDIPQEAFPATAITRRTICSSSSWATTRDW